MSMIKIEEKVVSIDKKMNKIISEYTKLMTSLKKIEGGDAGVLAAPEPCTLKHGMWNRAKNRFEQISGSLVKSSSVTFRAFEITANPLAFRLYEGYSIYLNSLLYAANRVGQQAISVETESAFVLVTDLFRRLAAVALSNDPRAHDVMAHIEAMRRFHTFIAGSKYVTKSSDFSVGLQKGHSEWIDVLQRMADFTSQLKAPNIAFFHLSEHLERVRLTAMKQILAFLADVSDFKLSDRFVTWELVKIENKKINNHDRGRDQTYEMPEESDVHQLVSNDKSGYLSVRYALLRKLENITQVISALSMATEGTGWVLFFAGIVDVAALRGLLVQFDGECKKALAVDTKLLSRKSKKALVKVQALTLGFQQDYRKGLESLAYLGDPIIIGNLKGFIMQAIGSINNNQLLCGHEGGNPIIRVELLKGLTDAFALEAPSAGPQLARNSGQVAVEEVDSYPNALPLVKSNQYSPLRRNSSSGSLSSVSSGMSYAAIAQRLEPNPTPQSLLPQRNQISAVKLPKLTTLNTKDRKKVKNLQELSDFCADLALLCDQQPESPVIGLLAGECLLRFIWIINAILEKPKIGRDRDAIYIKPKYDGWFHENLDDLCTLFSQLDKVYRDYSIRLSPKDRRKFSALDYDGLMMAIERYNALVTKQAKLEDSSSDDDSQVPIIDDPVVTAKGKEEPGSRAKQKVEPRNSDKPVVMTPDPDVVILDKPIKRAAGNKKRCC